MCRYKREYNDIQELLENRAVRNFFEEPRFKEIKSRVQRELKTGRLLKETLKEIVKWKTEPEPEQGRINKDRMPAKEFADNDQEEDIDKALNNMLGESTPEDKIKRLISLEGVGVAVASAILTAIYPKEYAVIDYRAWRVLCKYDVVGGHNCNQNLTPQNYAEFLSALTELARYFAVTPRAVEKTLWEYDESKKGIV